MSGSSAYTKLLVLLSTVVVATAAGISTFGHRGEIGTFEVPTAQAQPRRNGEPSAEAGKTIFAQERLEQYRLQPSSAALQSVGSQLTPHRVHALIEGIDAVPRELDDTALESLNDLWATHVLRQRRFPKDIVAILEALKPLEQQSPNQLQRSSFLVGEGGQIPISPTTPQQLDRTFRYVIAWKSVATGEAEIFLSIPAGTRSGVNELIAWDAKKRAFNFYRRMDPDHWLWRGDSSHAFDPRSADMGCFRCHPNGTLLMKELHRPWSNWHSEEALISATVVPDSMRPVDVPELKKLFDDRSAAQVLEQLISGGIERTNDERTSLRNGKLTHIHSLFHQLIDSRNANLLSSRTKGLTAGPATKVGLPLPFFFNSDAFVQHLGLQIAPADTSVSWPDYDKLVVRYGFKLTTGTFTRPGDTFFSFLIPEPAFETISLMTWMINRQIVSARFAICLQMVDFPNPVYSTVRDGLLRYISVLPDEADGTQIAGLEQKLVDAILNEATRQGSVAEDRLDTASCEQQFSFCWKIPVDTLSTLAGRHIGDYLQQVATRLTTADGLDDIVRLSISRRKQFKETRPGSDQAEFDLLFPHVNFDAGRPLRMRRDGTVETSRASP